MADSFDKMMDVADVYAEALHKLASEQKVVRGVYEELEELVKLYADDKTFAEFLRSSAVDADQRAASLDRLFRGKLSDLLLDTLQVMNRQDRLALLPALFRRYTLRAEEAEGMVEVTCISAVELTDEQKQRVERLAGELSRRKPLVTYTVDRGVIGGLVLQIGDFRFDDSLRRHLQIARTRLLERGDRGLRTAVSA